MLCILLLLSPFIWLPACAENLDLVMRMAEDFQVFLGAEKRVVLLDKIDVSPSAFNISRLSLTSLILTDVKETAESLARLSLSEELDLLVLPDISKTMELLSTLQEKLRIFDSKIQFLVPKQSDFSALRLRLDSRFYCFEESGNGFDLYEIYSIKDGKQITGLMGNWTAEHGLSHIEPRIWQRRSNLMGTILRHALLPWSTFNNLEPDGNGGIVNTGGVFAETMEQLEKRLNFSQVILKPEDGKAGGLEPDGKTWNGLVGMLIRDEADISAAGLTQYFERDQVVDFTIPLVKEGSTLIAPLNQGQETRFWVYVNIFAAQVWITTAVAGMILGLGFFAICQFGSNNFHRSDDRERFSVMNSMAVSALLFIQLCYDMLLESMSAKTLFMFASFMSFMVFNYYTCDLTAVLTSGQKPFVIK